jgi:hypothetical protein
LVIMVAKLKSGLLDLCTDYVHFVERLQPR